MKKLFSLIKSMPKRFSVLAIAAAVVIVPAMTLAWGPTDRATYTYENPAQKITFNSITNNPEYGDERNFVRIKDAADTGPGNWKDEIAVQPGKEYLVQMYVHNNAASSLGLVATNTRVMANVPATTGKSVQIDGFITADNSDPLRVWDQAIFTSDKNFNIAYVPGSTKFYNNVFGQTGVSLSDSIVTSAGALVGYDKLDGRIPGCFQYSGYVSFKVKPQIQETADFDLQKTVRVNGATDKTFKEDVTVKPGDKVDYQIYFKNTGQAQLKNVVLKDKLPAGVTYVPGTTTLYNASSNGHAPVADGITTNGLDIGGYVTGGNAYLRFTAQVAANSQLAVCGSNVLKNVAKATTAVGYKEDSANVAVTKTCKNSMLVCELATKNVVTIDESQFDGNKYSKDLTECTVPPTTPPTTPPELPKTGMGENIVAIVGLGAVIASIGYYIASRRALNQ